MFSNLKTKVKDHWEADPCGIRYGDNLESTRYSLEPYIPAFAEFEKAKGRKVLEIGVGAGVDFLNWVKNGAHATGVDLTEAAIKLTHDRLQHNGIEKNHYKLIVADAEHLQFQNQEFDLVYSWGVLHHTPDTVAAFEEAFRVLKPGGTLKAMIYHIPSWTGILLWMREMLKIDVMRGKFAKQILESPPEPYDLYGDKATTQLTKQDAIFQHFPRHPWKGMRRAIFDHLESPGTKAYTLRETREILHNIGFTNIHLRTKLCAGDLLQIKPSKKYQSRFYKIIWKLYPRWFVQLLGDRFGLELLITATKN